MILPPLASPQDFKAAILKPETYSDVDINTDLNEHTYWFIYSGNKLLISVDGNKLPSNHEFILINVLYLGTLKGIHLFSGEIQEEI